MKIENHILIIGAMKSGTTNLFKTLIEHDKIIEPKIKEPHFFSLDEKIIEENWGWYLKNLNNPTKLNYSIDATIHYLNSKRAIENINKYVKNPKILVIIRDPIKRIFSHYNHLRKEGGVIENRDFKEIYKFASKELAFKNLKDTENRNLLNAIRSKKIIENYYNKSYLRDYCGAPFDSNFEDQNRIFKYFQNSSYKKYIQAYEKKFPQKIKIIIFEEWIHDSGKVMGEIFNFIGLKNEKKRIKQSSQKYETLIPQNKVYNKLWSFYLNNHFSQKIVVMLKKIGLQIFFDKLRKIIFKKPKLSKEDYIIMKEILFDEYTYWFQREPITKKHWFF
jgi:hypothetical protein